MDRKYTPAWSKLPEASAVHRSIETFTVIIYFILYLAFVDFKDLEVTKTNLFGVKLNR